MVQPSAPKEMGTPNFQWASVINRVPGMENFETPRICTASSMEAVEGPDEKGKLAIPCLPPQNTV